MIKIEGIAPYSTVIFNFVEKANGRSIQSEGFIFWENCYMHYFITVVGLTDHILIAHWIMSAHSMIDFDEKKLSAIFNKTFKVHSFIGPRRATRRMMKCCGSTGSRPDPNSCRMTHALQISSAMVRSHCRRARKTSIRRRTRVLRVGYLR